MNFDDYQEFTTQTAQYPPEKGLEYTMLGLAGEVGELCNKYKKVLRGDFELTPEKKEEFLQEAGGITWYLARVIHELGGSFQEVAQTNKDILLSRLERNVIKGDGDNR